MRRAQGDETMASGATDDATIRKDITMKALAGIVAGLALICTPVVAQARGGGGGGGGSPVSYTHLTLPTKA